MDIVVIRNLNSDKCERINDTTLQVINYEEDSFAGFSEYRMYVYDYKKNYKIDVAVEIPKLDIADIEYAKKDRDYIVYTNAVNIGYNRFLIYFYSYNYLDDSNRIIAEYNLDIQKADGRIKAFVLDENNILIQEKTLDEEKPYELCIYRQLLDKPISVDIDVLSTYGIEKIISYHENNCAIQIGSDYSPVTYIGTILINKFISEISVNIGTDLYNSIEQSTDDTYITNLGVSGKYIYYMKVNAEDESEQVIVYDSESNSKRIRINYNINEKSRIEKIFLVGGEPIVITNANGEYKIVNLGTQSELMELKKGDEVLYIDDTFIVMNEYVRKFFWQKYTEMVTVYRYPGIYEDDKRILMENRRFFDYIQNSDELLILLEEERDGELKRTEEESEKTDSRVASNRIIKDCEEYKSADVVYAFVSFGREIDTSIIINNALENGKRLLLPRVTDRGMVFKEVKDLNELIKSNYGILEPSDDLPDVCEDGFMLVPGVVFGKNLYRIGYGGGFYDRFFAQTKDMNIYKAGYCHGYQIVDEVPTEEHDFKIDAIFSNDGVISR